MPKATYAQAWAYLWGDQGDEVLRLEATGGQTYSPSVQRHVEKTIEYLTQPGEDRAHLTRVVTWLNQQDPRTPVQVKDLYHINQWRLQKQPLAERWTTHVAPRQAERQAQRPPATQESTFLDVATGDHRGGADDRFKAQRAQDNAEVAARYAETTQALAQRLAKANQAPRQWTDQWMVRLAQQQSFKSDDAIVRDGGV